MRAWPVTLAVAFVLAGCMAAPADDDAADDPRDGADQAGAPVLLEVLDSADCQYNDLIWFVPIAQAQDLLPTGFQARPFTDGVGALIINAFDCGGTFAWNGWDLFVFALPPTMPGVVEEFDAANRTSRATSEHYQLDLYSLAAHTDHEGLRHVFGAGEIPVGPGVAARDNTVDSTVGVSFAMGTLRSGGQLLGQYVAEGALVEGQLGGLLTAHHRQWHVTDEGTLLIERVMTDDGAPILITQGPATCVLDPSTTFVAFVGPASCQFGQEGVGGFDWTGRAYFFPGVAPTA